MFFILQSKKEHSGLTFTIVFDYKNIYEVLIIANLMQTLILKE